MTDKTINCDQVAWLMAIFERYLPRSNHPRISVEREMMKHGMLYEVMDVMGVDFEDDSARFNGTPYQARNYEDAMAGSLNKAAAEIGKTL